MSHQKRIPAPFYCLLPLSFLPLFCAIPSYAAGAANFALFSPQDISLGNSNHITGAVASNSNVTLSTFTSVSTVIGGGALTAGGSVVVTNDIIFNGNVAPGSSNIFGGTIYSGGNVDLGFAANQTHAIVASGNVAQGQSALTTGDIHAGGSFSNQNFSNVLGNVFANSTATVNGTVTGNVTHGGQLTIGPFGSVTGATPTGITPVNPLHYAQVSLPGAISFSSGGTNISSGGTLQAPLAPGSYGDLSISTFGKLYLTAGDYYFNSFTFGGDSIRLLNLTPSSHIRIFVTGNVSETTFSTMFVNEVPFDSADSALASNVLLETLGNYAQNTSSVDFFGTLFAPKGSITLGSSSSVTGSVIAGGKITTGSSFNTQFVKSTLLPDPPSAATWNGSVGNWSDASKWSSTPQFPNNGNGGSIYDVTLNAGTVTLDVDVTINNITASGGSITGSHNLSLVNGIILGGLNITGALAILDTLNLAGANQSTGAISGHFLIVSLPASLTSSAMSLDQLSVSGSATIRPSSGTSKVNTLVIENVNNAFNGKLDITSNILIVQAHSPADKTAKAHELASAILSASAGAGGAWTGKGITSSTAKNDPTHYALALFDNAALQRPIYGSQSADDNSLILTPAHLGDANFNGQIDIQDQSLVTNHWQSAQNTWSTGDLNLDGFVDLQDLTLVTNNWQQSSAFVLTSNLQLVAPSNVPEPATLTLLLCFLLFFRKRPSLSN